MVLTLHRKY